MKKTKLAHAVAMAITGTALSMGAVSTASATSTTMYNLYRANSAGFTAGLANPCSPCSNSFSTPPGIPGREAAGSTPNGYTDGWVWDQDPIVGSGADRGTAPGAANPLRPGWVGTTATLATPFGYAGGGVLHWAAELTGGQGGTATISNADSIARYNTSADIDVAGGSWSDNAQSGQGGWVHDLDFGLFRSDASGQVNLSVTGVNNTGNTAFGFTVFKGINTSTNAYAHHGAWNAGTNTQTGAPTPASVPRTNAQGFNLTVADIVAYSIGDDPATTSVNEAQNIGNISFNAIAGEIYTIALGGYRTSAWNQINDGYSLTVSQVPVPAAAWLFGGAMVSLVGAIRRKRIMPV